MIFTRILEAYIRLLQRMLAFAYGLQGNPAWRSFDGRVIRISEMESRHMINCLAMVRRNNAVLAPHIDRAFSKRWKECMDTPRLRAEMESAMRPNIKNVRRY
jgi:hypothetical protein